MARSTLLAVAVVAALGGCANVGLPPLTCPGRGGPRWVAVSAPRVDVKSDLPRERAEAIARDIDRAYAMVSRGLDELVGATATKPTQRLQVVVFARAADVTSLDPEAAGYFHFAKVGWDERPTIVLSPDGFGDEGRLVRHELVHHLVAHALPTAPRWLNEGFADVLSTVRVAGRQLELGAWSRALDRWGVQPTVRELFAASDERVSAQPGHYTQAAQLVHFLSSTSSRERPRFLAFLQRIGAGVRWDVAWEETFPGVDLDALDAAIGRDRVSLGLHRLLARVDWTDGEANAPLTTTELSDGDVHLIWVALRSWDRAGALARVRQDLAQARTGGGAPVELAIQSARLAWYEGRGGELDRLVLDALAKHPAVPELLAVAAGRMLEVPELKQRLAAHARTAYELDLLARLVLDEGAPREALEHARRATAARPSSATAWRRRAEAAEAAAEPAEALASTKRWAWLAPSDGEAIAALVDRGGEPDLPPARTRAGVVLEGRLVEADGGAPLGGFVHVATNDDWSMVRVARDGRFRLVIAPGKARLTTVAFDRGVLWDERIETVRPGAGHKALGDVPLLRGVLPAAPLAYDGLSCLAVDGVATVVEVSPHSPADRADLRRGDRIVAVNGRDVRRWSHRAIDAVLAGGVGDRVKVTYERAGAASEDVELMLAPTARGVGRAAIVIDTNAVTVNGVELAGSLATSVGELEAVGMRFGAADASGRRFACAKRATLWGTAVPRACVYAEQENVVSLFIELARDRAPLALAELTRRLGPPLRPTMWNLSGRHPLVHVSVDLIGGRTIAVIIYRPSRPLAEAATPRAPLLSARSNFVIDVKSIGVTPGWY